MFNVGLLAPYCEDLIGRPQLAIPAPDIVDNEPSYVVAQVLDRGMEILSQSFLTAFYNIYLLGKGMDKRKIPGKHSKC